MSNVFMLARAVRLPAAAVLADFLQRYPDGRGHVDEGVWTRLEEARTPVEETAALAALYDELGRVKTYVAGNNRAWRSCAVRRVALSIRRQIQACAAVRAYRKERGL